MARDFNQIKDVFNQFVSFAGQSKNEVIQTLCHETGKAIAEALKEPLLAAMEEKRLHISLELEDIVKKPVKVRRKKKKKKVAKKARSRK